MADCRKPGLGLFSASLFGQRDISLFSHDKIGNLSLCVIGMKFAELR